MPAKSANTSPSPAEFYALDNSLLRSRSTGIHLRLTPSILDNDLSTPLLKWGTIVRGVQHVPDLQEGAEEADQAVQDAELSLRDTYDRKIPILKEPREWLLVDGVRNLKGKMDGVTKKWYIPMDITNVPILLKKPGMVWEDAAEPEVEEPVARFQPLADPTDSPPFPLGSGMRYEVVFDSVVVRAAPSLGAKAQSREMKGTVMEMFDWDESCKWRAVYDRHKRVGWMLLDHPEFGPLLRPQCLPYQLKPVEPLVLSVLEEDLCWLRQFLSAGVDVNTRDAGDRTALMVAAEFGRHGPIVLLCASGADASLRNFQEETALELADTEVTQALVLALTERQFDSEACQRAVSGLTGDIRDLAEDLLERKIAKMRYMEKDHRGRSATAAAKTAPGQPQATKMAESVVVGVRVRPFNDREKALNAELCIEMDGPTTTIKNLKCGEGVPTSFTFDESFWSHDGFEDDGTGYNRAAPGSQYKDQNYVFETFGQRVLNNAWEGFHCCLFAYGQTGSGKSYSMVGYGKNKGIVPISCEEIFRRIDANTNDNLKYEVVVSVVEIYNELVQDLLIAAEDRPKKGLDIRESKLLGIYIDGVQKRPVDSYHAIEKTIDEATENRTVGSTMMNATSSRAHTVITIEFKSVEKVPGASDSVKVSMINLVDLAGSEKAGQTGATGMQLKEGAAINKSLSALGNVIEKLAQKSGGKKNVIVPYRESKLTRLLQNALGGSSKTIMICALSPASSNYEETLSTLRYADRAKRIKNTAVVNENPQEKLMRELREENNKLKEFMESVKDTLGEQDAAALNERVKEIKAAEEALKESQKTFEEKLQESRDHEKQRDSRRTMFRTNVFGAKAEMPHIVNLNEDMLLTGRIKHRFPEGKTVTIGQDGVDDEGKPEEEHSSDEEDGEVEETGEAKDQADDHPEIQIAGEGVLKHHATVTNTMGRCVLRSKGKAADATHVNGVSVAVLLKQKEVETTEAKRASLRGSLRGSVRGSVRGSFFETNLPDGEPPEDKDGLVLNHGDRVAFSQCLFVFVDPSKGMAEMLIMSGEVTYFGARKELAKNQWKSAGLKFMKGMKLTKAVGGKDLSNTLLRKMSLGSSKDSAAAEAARLGAASGEESPDDDSTMEDSVEQLLAEGLDEDTAMRLIRAKDRQLAEKERELQELRRQLAERDAQLAEARAAAAAGGRGLEGLGSLRTDSLGVQLPQLPGLTGRRPNDVRAEIASTFESAISAIEQVEAIFTVRQAARKQTAS